MGDNWTKRERDDIPKREHNETRDAKRVTQVVDNKGNNAGVQYPLSTDGDSIYCKDINAENSDLFNFSGEVCDLVNSLKSVITDSTNNNPKQLKLWFERTIYATDIGLGCDDMTKGFGTDITVKLLGSGEEVRYTKNYTGLNPNSALLRFGKTETQQGGLQAFNGLILEFNTTDEVCLSNLTIRKSFTGDFILKGLNDFDETVESRFTKLGNVKVAVDEYGDTSAIDAFDRLRISENFTLFDSKQLHDKQPLFWDEELGGGATSAHNPVNASTEMVATTAGDYVIRQTKQRFNYQPGKSQLIFMTFYCPQTADVTKRIGIFDDDGTGNNLTPNNGIFFETNTGLYWNITKNGTITERVAQADWNVDTLDGSVDINNPSGIQYNPDSTHIMIIDYEWLGVGRVRVGFVIGGLIRYVHYFKHANVTDFTSVYMSTPNLPLRYSIESTGGACQLDHICSSVVSEGGQEQTGILRSVDTGFTHIDASTANTTYAIKGIRLKDLYKDITVLPEYFSMIDEIGNAFRWSLQLNPIVNGTFTYSDITNSAVQHATGVTANTIATPGLIIDSGYVGASGTGNSGTTIDRKIITSLRIGSTIAGVQDELVLCVTPLGSNSDIQGSLTFRELL